VCVEPKWIYHYHYGIYKGFFSAFQLCSKQGIVSSATNKTHIHSRNVIGYNCNKFLDCVPQLLMNELGMSVISVNEKRFYELYHGYKATEDKSILVNF